MIRYGPLFLNTVSYTSKIPQNYLANYSGLCMHIHIYIHICVYMYTHTHTYICIYIFIRVYIYIYTHVHSGPRPPSAGLAAASPPMPRATHRKLRKRARQAGRIAVQRVYQDSQNQEEQPLNNIGVSRNEGP